MKLEKNGLFRMQIIYIGVINVINYILFLYKQKNIRIKALQSLQVSLFSFLMNGLTLACYTVDNRNKSE